MHTNDVNSLIKMIIPGKKIIINSFPWMQLEGWALLEDIGTLPSTIFGGQSCQEYHG